MNATIEVIKQLRGETGAGVMECRKALEQGNYDFEKALDIRNDPQRVVLDFQHSNISDMGALESLNKMTGKYRTVGKSLVVENLDAKSRSLLQKAAGMSAVQVV